MNIKKYLLKNYLLLSLSMPIVVYILFNVSLKLYSYEEAKLKLEEATSRYINSSNDIFGGDFDANDNRFVNGLFNFYRDENIEVIIRYNDELIQTPKAGNQTFLTKENIEDIKNTNFIDSNIVTISTSDNIIHAKSVQNSENLEVIFIANTFFADNLSKTLNQSLLIIFVLIMIVYFLISTRLSKKLSNQIKNITFIVDQMNPRECILIKDNQEIEELNHLKEKINDMSKRIYSYNKNQNMYLEDVSHEIRTPLMSIKGYAEGIKNNIDFDKDKALDIVINETDKMNRLVTSLITLSKIDNVEYKKELLSTSDFLTESIEKVEVLALNKKITINLINKSDNLDIQMNTELLDQCISNVLNNCIKYSKTKIDITLYNNKITIKNDGPKISKKDLENIFTRFYKGNTGNFGLGMSIAKKAIEKHGGEITIKNVPTGVMYTIIL